MSERPEESQKTEEPTQRKLDEARRKGDVPFSREVGSMMLVLAGVVLVGGLGSWMGGRLTDDLLPLVENPGDFPLQTPADAFRLLAWLGGEVGMVLLPAAAILIAAVLLGAIGQNGIVFTTERLKPKLERISPIAGLRRLVSLRTLVEFLKGLAKVAAVGAALLVVLEPELHRIEALTLTDVAALPELLSSVLTRLLLATLVASIAIALLDLVWQQFSWRRQQRMTVQELKEEFRQAEGDPHVKARISQLRRERARQRMFSDIPRATVVITNPTHFAVALRYDLSEAPAPVCLAKGMDLVARRIREAAVEHKVPVVENPPLARALHKSVEIGEEVQPEHYMAVAEVISYVVGLQARARGGAPQPPGQPPAPSPGPAPR